MAIIDDRTAGRDYALPNAANKLKDDVVRLRAQIAATDGDVTALLLSLDAKADAAHVHTIANVTGLSAALDGKISIGYHDSLNDLADVSVTGAANGQVLIKQGASWIPIALQVGNVTGLEALLNSKATPADIAALVDSAPGTLDTLNELAAALGDDPNFATTVTNSIALKAPLASPALTGTPTAPTAAPGTETTQVATTAFVKSEVAASGPVTNDNSLTGSVVQSAYQQYSSNTNITTVLPMDGTAPQNTEGVEITSITITPRSATNRLSIEFDAFGTGSEPAYLSSALFKDTDVGAISASTVYCPSLNHIVGLRLRYEFVAGSTSAQTFAVRCGPASGTMRLNGTTTGTAFAGVSRATMYIREIKA